MIIVAQINFKHDFEKITQQVRDAVEGVVTNSTFELLAQAQRNVSGPAPTFLQQKTGNLFASLANNTTVTSDGFVFKGAVGTDVLSKDGFAYGAYWENAIPSAKVTHDPFPRAFLKPALDTIKETFFSNMKQAVQQAIGE